MVGGGGRSAVVGLGADGEMGAAGRARASGRLRGCGFWDTKEGTKMYAFWQPQLWGLGSHMLSPLAKEMLKLGHFAKLGTYDN